jgi:hypothetical protein
MIQTLPNLLMEIRDDLRTLPSIKRLHEDVPESLNEFPAVVVVALGGRCWLATHDGDLMCEHDIRVEVHIARKNLAENAARMTAVADDVTLWLYNGFVRDRYNLTMVTTGSPQTGNNATSPLEYSIEPSMWGAQQTYAMLCDFKIATVRETTP